MTAETQKAGTQKTSDSKPDGNFYTAKCKNCGESQPEKVREIIQNTTG